MRRRIFAWLVIVLGIAAPTGSAHPAPAGPGPPPGLPDGFPARGARNAAGNLVGKAFVAHKAVVRTLTVKDAALELYGWSQGTACDHQFAPDAGDLYVRVSFPADRAIAGAVISDSDRGVSTTYRKPTFKYPLPSTRTTFVIDEIDGKSATGRLLFTASDGSRVAGSFHAAFCGTAQRTVTAPPSLLGLRWGQMDVEPGALPSKPVTTLLLGQLASPVAVETIDWQSGDYGQHEVHFFLDKPASSCGFEVSAPGFKVMLPAIAPKVQAKTTIRTVSRRGDPGAVVLWREPGNVTGVEGDGFLSAIVDSISPTTVHGRVFAWFSDASKSMIAGAFVAKRCHVSP